MPGKKRGSTMIVFQSVIDHLGLNCGKKIVGDLASSRAALEAIPVESVPSFPPFMDTAGGPPIS